MYEKEDMVHTIDHLWTVPGTVRACYVGTCFHHRKEMTRMLLLTYILVVTVTE
jgi:hypothetical protein